MRTINAALIGVCALSLGACQNTTATKTSMDNRKPMSKAQIMAALRDVTVDGVYLPKDSRFNSYLAPDGELIVVRNNGERSQGRRWYVKDDGQRCVTNPKWEKPNHKWQAGRCFDVYDIGGGVYHMYDHGTRNHTHVLTNVRQGNRL